MTEPQRESRLARAASLCWLMIRLSIPRTAKGREAFLDGALLTALIYIFVALLIA